MRGDRQELLTTWSSHPRCGELLAALDCASDDPLCPAELEAVALIIKAVPFLRKVWRGRRQREPRRLLYGVAAQLIEHGLTLRQVKLVVCEFAIHRRWSPDVAEAVAYAAWRRA